MPSKNIIQHVGYPGLASAVVVPSAAANLPGGVTRKFYVGGAGNLHCWLDGDDLAGAARVFTAIQIGVAHELAVKRVSDASTCTLMVAIY